MGEIPSLIARLIGHDLLRTQILVLPNNVAVLLTPNRVIVVEISWKVYDKSGTAVGDRSRKPEGVIWDWRIDQGNARAIGRIQLIVHVHTESLHSVSDLR